MDNQEPGREIAQLIDDLGPARDEGMLRKVGDYIATHPEQYDQNEWCGTAFCVAGTTCFLSPEFAEWEEYNPRFTDLNGKSHLIEDYAGNTLGLSEGERNVLFSAAWMPTGMKDIPIHLRVRDALYQLADGATIGEVTKHWL